MKNKKVYIVMALIILSIILAIQPNVYAAKTLKAQKLREGIGGVTPYAYQLQQKDVWKIYEAENNYSQAIYCLEAGIGNLWSGNEQGVVYDTSVNMKQSSNALQSAMLASLGQNPTEKLSQDEGYKAEELLKATNNNGSILWLLDNFYLPKHPNEVERIEMRNALLQAAFKGKIDAGELTLQDIKLTDDDIEVVQQWALWQFTTQNNYDANYTSSVLPEMYIATGQNDATLGQYSALSDLGRLVDENDPTHMIGEYRQEDAQTLFDYLVSNARQNANYTGIENQTTLNFINPTTGKFDGTKVGEFEITATNKEKLYNFTLQFKDQNDNIIPETNYTVEDALGQVIATDISIIGKEFYVRLNDPTGQITKLTAEVSAKYVTTTATKWINTTSQEDEQDVVIIEKTPVTISDSKTIVKVEVPEPETPEFDLHLRKFITDINGKEVTGRIPIVDVTPLKQGTTDAIYNHPKTPVSVKTGDIVTYTIRVYNEGEADGYAQIVMDDIPEGLEFLRDDETNKEYRWVYTEGLKTVTTDYLSKEQEENEGDNLIKGFDIQTGQQLDYRDLKIVFKVIEKGYERTIITNTAEITDDADEDGKDIDDRDSVPNNAVIGDKTTYEDDTDEEHLILQHFDLSLTKHLVSVNELNIIGREPIAIVKEDGTIEFDESGKEKPVEVEQNDIVVYAIRVYNEGLIDGYATEVIDDVPEGLEFIDDPEIIDINEHYRWKLSEDGKTVTTDYLSKEQEQNPGDNLIKAFDRDTMEKPDYKELLIAFKVLPSEEKGKIIINTAEISDDSDENGNEIEDIDSTPDNNIPEEDDIDTEHIYVKYFDLSLLKWVSRVIITDNGETTTIETGHNGSENPEPPAKVEIHRWRINKVDVRFVFEIKVTNEGEIAGYAKEIKDHVPEGLEFVQEDNPKWTIDGDVVTTTQLADTLLKPGESAVISITLRWENSEDNMGEMINSAEISEDYNESETEDIDSTPDNNIPEEDDQDPAPVLISIGTGGITIYYTLIAASVVILGVGLILIKKYII